MTDSSIPRQNNIWMILVDFNGLADTRKCLQSLRHLSVPASVVVVDNASTTAVAPVLASEFPEVDFVQSPINGGWAGGNNLGVCHALERGAEWMILLNNDTTAHPDLVKRLMEAAVAYPHHGVLGPIIMFMDEPEVVQTTGVIFNRPERPGFFQSIPVPRDSTRPASVVDCDIVNGCCLMIHRDVVATIGLVDEQFFLIHEEADWCLRAQKVTRLGVVTDGLVFHKGSSTFKREGSRVQRYFDTRNIPRLLWKHRARRNARSLLAGLLHYVQYVYHRYSHEREGGRMTGAEAVVEGFYDGMTGSFGPMRPRWRPGITVLKGFFAFVWRLRNRGEPEKA